MGQDAGGPDPSRDTLARVYRAFGPEPLEGDQDEALYVDLDDVRGSAGFVHRLEQRIRLEGRPTCQLVTGHRGSGKSTELRRLQKRMESAEPRSFVVFVHADDDLDRNDLDFPDLLIALVRQIAAQLRERAGIELAPGYFRDRWERIKTLMGSPLDLEGISLDAGMVRLSTLLRSGPEARARLREALEPDAGGWLDAANDVIDRATIDLGKTGRGSLVVIVDDLEKMVLREQRPGESTAEHLFIARHAQLTALRCHVVYTVPIALAYSLKGEVVTSLYGARVPIVPMIKIRERPPSDALCAPGIDRMRQIMAKRVERAGCSEVFADHEVVNRLIDLSGGQPRELMVLVREALVADGIPIQDGAVARAAAEGKRAYARQIRSEHHAVLREVRDTGAITRTRDSDQAVRELLDSRACLQYVNDVEWYRINPLVEPPAEVGEA